MGRKKQRTFTVKSYKTMKGRQLFFIKSKTYIKSYYFNRNKRYFQYKSDDTRFKSCSIKYKYELEDLKQAEKSVTKEKTKKKKLWSWLIVFVNIAVVAIIFANQFASGEAVGFFDLFKQPANWSYLGIALLLTIASMVLDATKTYNLIWISTHRHRPFLAYKSTALCRYYDAITPMSTGGEPFQIYYLKNRGVRGEVATSIPIVKSLFWQIGNSIIAVFFLLFNSGAYANKNPIIITIAWISVAFNVIVLSVIFMLSLSKKIGPRIVIGVLKLLAKMHIIKNYQLTFRKVMRFVLNYQTCMRSFASNIFTVLLQLVLAMGEILVVLLIPYFVYRTFPAAGTNYSAVDIMTMTVICNMVSFIIPIPGGAGAAEFSFLTMFESLFPADVKVWALLIWRILTYYSILIRGILITIYDGVYGNKKSEALVQSGYFTEKIHFSMIKRKQLKSRQRENQLKQTAKEQAKLQASEQAQNQSQENVTQPVETAESQPEVVADNVSVENSKPKKERKSKKRTE